MDFLWMTLLWKKHYEQIYLPRKMRSMLYSSINIITDTWYA